MAGNVTITGFEFGLFELSNTGIITGNVTLNSATLSRNDGSILGNLVMSDKNDVYIATGEGFVSGFLSGGEDADLLFDASRNHNIQGDAGEDTIEGGTGRDQLFGGSGADNFVFHNAGDSGTGAAADIIRDFTRGEDLIDLELLVAGELSFNGTGGFSGGGNASLRYVLTTEGVSVRIDMDGFGGTDLQFTVAGVTSLDATDFIL